MGVYAKNGSRFWWVWLEGQKKPFSSKIPIGSGAGRRASRVQAEDIYLAAMGDLARGVFQLPNAKPRMTFRAWAAWYQENVSDQQRSKMRARSMIKALVRHFGEERLHTIDEHRIEEWKAARAKEVRPVTVNRELEILKPLLRKAIPKYLDKNPADGVRRFTVRRPPVTIVAESAEAALLEIATVEERAMYLLGTDALLRLGDVRRLRLEHDHGTHLDIVDPKTTPYTVPVSGRLRAALDAQKSAAQAGFYFPRRYKQRWAAMNENTAYRVFVDLCARANVPRGRQIGGITFHSTRHTGATRAARKVKLSVVKRLGNWSSLDMLERYDHPDDPELVRAVEAIGSTAAVNQRESGGTNGPRLASNVGVTREKTQAKRA
jgi:integrase